MLIQFKIPSRIDLKAFFSFRLAIICKKKVISATASKTLSYSRIITIFTFGSREFFNGSHFFLLDVNHYFLFFAYTEEKKLIFD